jgi:hypothetical protein
MLRFVVFRGYCLGVLFLLILAWPLGAQCQPGRTMPTNTKARGLYEKALLQSKERDFVKAVETLTVLNQKFPSFGDAFIMKGSLLKALGDNRGALAAYRDGLAKVPPTPSRTAEYRAPRGQQRRRPVREPPGQRRHLQ